jgi:hypothetical protein
MTPNLNRLHAEKYRPHSRKRAWDSGSRPPEYARWFDCRGAEGGEGDPLPLVALYLQSSWLWLKKVYKQLITSAFLSFSHLFRSLFGFVSTVALKHHHRLSSGVDTPAQYENLGAILISTNCTVT